jgi:hypothetical protein
MPKVNDAEFEAFCSVCGSGICENVQVREDKLWCPRIIIEPCAECREAQIRYGADREKLQWESKAPETLRCTGTVRCERCEANETQLRVFVQLAVSAKKIVDMRRFTGPTAVSAELMSELSGALGACGLVRVSGMILEGSECPE